MASNVVAGAAVAGVKRPMAPAVAGNRLSSTRQTMVTCMAVYDVRGGIVSPHLPDFLGAVVTLL